MPIRVDKIKKVHDLHEEICDNVRRALTEDIGSGDLTALLIPSDKTLKANVITRESAVLCGMQWFEACFTSLSPEITIEWFFKDADRVQAH